MGFELDKHDLFRNAMPGFVFLFVLFTFYFFNHHFVVEPKDTINVFLTVMALAITLPIGYLIHNLYKAWHIITGEQSSWEDYEAAKVKKTIKTDKLKALEGESDQKEGKIISWSLETILHGEDNESIKDRGYALITRIHACGGTMMAIVLGIVVAVTYFKMSNISLMAGYKGYLFVMWIAILKSLDKVRMSTIEGHQYLMKHFINLKADEIKALLTKG